MVHALIIHDNMAISRAIKDRLTTLGFDSFDQTFTERQAFSVASCRRPDLVVIGDMVTGTAPQLIADHIFESFGAPILRVALGHCDVRRQIPQGAFLSSPFSLSDIGMAVAVACPTLTANSPAATFWAGDETTPRVMQAA